MGSPQEVHMAPGRNSRPTAHARHPHPPRPRRPPHPTPRGPSAPRLTPPSHMLHVRMTQKVEKTTVSASRPRNALMTMDTHAMAVACGARTAVGGEG